jgi:hypothetical protein
MVYLGALRQFIEAVDKSVGMAIRICVNAAELAGLVKIAENLGKCQVVELQQFRRHYPPRN